MNCSIIQHVPVTSCAFRIHFTSSFSALPNCASSLGSSKVQSKVAKAANAQSCLERSSRIPCAHDRQHWVVTAAIPDVARSVQQSILSRVILPPLPSLPHPDSRPMEARYLPSPATINCMADRCINRRADCLYYFLLQVRFGPTSIVHPGRCCYRIWKTNEACVHPERRSSLSRTPIHSPPQRERCAIGVQELHINTDSSTQLLTYNSYVAILSHRTALPHN